MTIATFKKTVPPAEMVSHRSSRRARSSPNRANAKPNLNALWRYAPTTLATSSGCSVGKAEPCRPQNAPLAPLAAQAYIHRQQAQAPAAKGIIALKPSQATVIF